MKISKLVFIGVLVSPTAYTEVDTVSKKDYQSEIVKGREALDYSDSLLDQNSLHTLIEAAAAEGNSNSDGSEVTENNSNVNATESNQRDNGASGDVPVRPDSSSGKPVDEKADGQQPSTKADRQNVNAQEQQKKPVPPKNNLVPDGSSSTGQKVSSGSNAEPSRVKSAQADPTYYIDPLLNQGGLSIPVSNRMVDERPNARNAIKFGITIGSQFKVRLKNGANNTQDGFVVFEIAESVTGYKQTLPAGTLLFATPRAVIGDQRLYCDVTRGITPDNMEFRLSGSIVGYDKNPGLVATVKNDGRSLKRAGTTTIFSVANSLTQTLPGTSISANAGREGVEALLNEKQDGAELENGRPAYIVEAAIQSAYVSVIETF